ncbi:MAG: polyprenyl synthetase family protein [Thermoleophilia bacterium]
MATVGRRLAEQGATYPEALRELAEAYLESLDFAVEGRVSHLADAMRYSLLACGKRIRPVLTLATAVSLAAPPQQVLAAAAALELIHTYSLIHDDLPAIDNDDLRRGKPTCHVVYGEDIAILAGDGLFAEAFVLILERQSGDPRALLAALAEIARATGLRGMVGGQYLDVTAVAGGDNDLRRLHALKTGRLIEAAVVCGALLAVPGQVPDLAAFRAFAAELGLLFQIVDDVLDVEGDDSKLGKTAGKDEAQGKLTYVSRYGLEGAVTRAQQSYRRALADLDALSGDTTALRGVAGYIYSRAQ